MKTYYIEYQIEDEEPEHQHIKAVSEVNAIATLKSNLRQYLRDEAMLEHEEASELVEKISILEIYVV